MRKPGITAILIAFMIVVLTQTAAAQAAVEYQQSLETTVDATDDLLQMREEEKLARDVYLALFDRWGARIFQTIAESEQRHMDALGSLLANRGIDDPVADLKRGEFASESFASLYRELVEQGSKSLVDALFVGATIEDLDIHDLQTALEHTEDEDIVKVYSLLLRASEHHMNAFTKQLERFGNPYEAK